VSLTDDELGRIIRAALSQGASSPKVSDTKPKAKRTPAKKKRKPSAYNVYMKKELARLKKKHPRSKHPALFKRAAKSWKRSPDRKRSMK
jgi:hypothetical protein